MVVAVLRHRLWSLTTLGLVALVAVAIMGLLFGSAHIPPATALRAVWAEIVRTMIRAIPIAALPAHGRDVVPGLACPVKPIQLR